MTAGNDARPLTGGGVQPKRVSRAATVGAVVGAGAEWDAEDPAQTEAELLGAQL